MLTIKLLHLFVMLVLIIVCVATKESTIQDDRVYYRVESVTEDYESFNETCPIHELDRMMKGFETMKSSIFTFCRFLHMKPTDTKSRFSILWKMVEQNYNELNSIKNKGIEIDLIKVKEMRRNYDMMRDNFNSLTTISYKYASTNMIIAIKNKEAVQSFFEFCKPNKKYKPVDNEETHSKQINVFAVNFLQGDLVDAGDSIIDKNIALIQTMVKLKNAPDQRLKAIPLKPVYIKEPNEWAFAVKAKTLTLNEVSRIKDWSTFSGGMSLLQKSIQTVNTLEKKSALNIDIEILKAYGSSMLLALNRARDSGSKLHEANVKTILRRYATILNGFAALMHNNNMIIRESFDAVAKYELKFAISSWPNLARLKPLYAFSDEQKAFAKSAEKLVFDEVKENQDYKCFIGGLMLLQDSIQKVDRFSQYDRLNTIIRDLRGKTESMISGLKYELSNGCHRNDAKIRDMVNQIGFYLNKYVKVLAKYKPRKMERA